MFILNLLTKNNKEVGNGAGIFTNKCNFINNHNN